MRRADREDKEQNRFGFGRNWMRYVGMVDDERITAAEDSLREMLGRLSLEGENFLDAGSGSGLFSLAARNLGASVHSFDYDRESIACTRTLRDRYRPGDSEWTIETGDVLDRQYIERLGKFSIVYSWGVLHHTGDMWNAFENVMAAVEKRGHLFVALYNDQGWRSKYWRHVKKLYNRSTVWKWLVILTHTPWFLVRQLIKGILKPTVVHKRGMDAWRDLVDWLGGYPFEVTRPDAVLAFGRDRGFVLERMVTVGGRHGCNQFVFMALAEGP